MVCNGNRVRPSCREKNLRADRHPLMIKNNQQGERVGLQRATKKRGVNEVGEALKGEEASQIDGPNLRWKKKKIKSNQSNQ